MSRAIRFRNGVYLHSDSIILEFNGVKRRSLTSVLNSLYNKGVWDYERG